MKCKSLALMAIIMFSCFVSLSQELTNEAKIVEVYGQEWLDARKVDQPDLLILMDKYISYGFMVHSVDEGKYSEIEAVESIPITSKVQQNLSIQQFLTEFESEGFNPLRYRFFPTTEYQIIRLAGINKIIYILPQDIILSK
jgi:hypothetical protein